MSASLFSPNLDPTKPAPASAAVAVTPTAATAAPQDMNTAIKDYVSQVMAGNWTDQQKAEMIRNQANAVGVNASQIAQATGYSLDNVNAYMNSVPQQAASLAPVHNFQPVQNVAPQAADSYRPADWVSMYRFALQDPTTRAALFKERPDLATDYARISRGEQSQYTTDGTSLIKSDLNAMPEDVAAYYRKNPNALLAAEGFRQDPVLSYINQTQGQAATGYDKNSYTGIDDYMKNHRWTPNGIQKGSVGAEMTKTPFGSGYASYAGEGVSPVGSLKFISNRPEDLVAAGQGQIINGAYVPNGEGGGGGSVTNPIGEPPRYTNSGGTGSGGTVDRLFGDYVPRSPNAGIPSDYNPNQSGAGGTSTDYQDQLNSYYKAYFGNDSSVNNTMLNSWYGGNYAPTPTGFGAANKGASAARGIVQSLKWDPTNYNSSIVKLNEYRQTYGLSAKDIANAIGTDEATVISEFAKVGISVPVTQTAPPPQQAGLNPNDGQ